MTTRITATRLGTSRHHGHPVVATTTPGVRNQAAIGVLQRKLRVGPVGDRFEQEADSVAQAVMRMPHPVAVQRCPGGCPGEEEAQRQPLEEEEEEEQELQPKSADEMVARQQEVEEEEMMPKSRGGVRLDGATEAQIAAKRGAGGSLPPAERSFFEPRFDRDFGSVRLHVDQGAADLSRRVNARAFTVGSDIFFGAGEYRPGTDRGRRLVAHELTHVIQQGG